MFPIRDHNPSQRTPYVTIALISANVLVFLLTLPYQLDGRALAELYRDYALIPAGFVTGLQREGILTSMFLHAGWMHLLGNMLFLWIFGDNLENRMGHVWFLAFYLVSGVAAALAHIVAEPASFVPTVGASGAIAGVMGGYLLLFPKARVDVLFFLVFFIRIIAVPAWLVLGIWFGLQLFSGLGSPAGTSGIAYWAHAGGFLAGLVMTVPLWLRLGGQRFWSATAGHPAHAASRYRLSPTDVPKAGRRR